MKKINLLIIHAHFVVAKSLDYWFNGDPRFNVRAVCMDSLLGLDFITDQSLDVAIVDIACGPVPGDMMIRHIRRKNIHVKIVCLSSATDPSNFVPKFIEAGASCFLAQDRGFVELARTVWEIGKNEDRPEKPLGISVSAAGNQTSFKTLPANRFTDRSS